MRSTAKGDPGLVFYLFVRAFTWFEPASFVFLLAVASWLGCRCGLVALWWRCCGECTGAVFLVLSEVQF